MTLHRLVAAALLLAIVMAPPATAGALSPDADWREALAAAGSAHSRHAYTGEVMWATWEGGESHAATTTVHSPALAANGAAVVSKGPGLVPRTDSWGALDPARLEQKYKVDVVGSEHALRRPCALVEIRDRSGGHVRERLWVDRASGVVLRRESYHEGDLHRLAVFLSLEGASPPIRTHPGGAPAADPGAAQAAAAVEVSPPGRRALRATGWALPEALPGGYRLREVHAHGGRRGPTLQGVYDDGLYEVSLFEQHGVADFAALPEGSREAEWLDFAAYEWPGALPRRLVWSDGAATFTLVGDAPPDEFRVIVQSLPRPVDESWVRRAADELGRWWAALSSAPRPWGQGAQ